MPNVNINVDLILTVAVDIIAFAGDQLIVLGNTVIGVIPAKDRSPERHTVEVASEVITTEPVDKAQRVYELYKEHGPCTPRFIGDVLGIPPSNRYWIKQGQGRLLRLKKIVAVSKDRFPEYKIADKAQG